MFPLVCFGGASGDLATYEKLISLLPHDLGIAIVIVNGLTVVPSLLLETLPRFTEMPVELITDALPVRPNIVFIAPPEHDLHVSDGTFHLLQISKPTGWPDVITVFLRSMTHNWHGRIIAVILSGYDGDGAVALQGIREAGGVTFALESYAASQPDMPLSAIASGNIDFILPAEGIARQIQHIALAMRSL